VSTGAAGVIAAPLDGWQKHLHVEDVWGTTVAIDIRGESLDLDETADAVAAAVGFLHDVDDWFSTYRHDTPITFVRNGLWDVSRAPAVVQDVLARCAALRNLTQGAFNPWAVPGGVDPSGYVKGWAADLAASMLRDRGFENVSINAGGDISCRGSMSPGRPWAVGIRHHARAEEIVRVVELTDGSIATSGLYERGAHVINPRTGDRTMAVDSATVVGPDGGMADALATACLIEGPTCATWFADLPEWSVYLMTRETASFFGPAFEPGEPTP